MNGVAIDWVRIGFFMIVEDNVAREGASANDVSVCDDQALPYVSMVESKGGSLVSEVPYPLSASTTKPVASLAQATSVSKEQV